MLISTHDDILRVYEQQSALIRDALINGEYNLAILAADTLHTALQVKISELVGKEGE
jgi:hypothetical protein